MSVRRRGSMEDSEIPTKSIGTKYDDSCHQNPHLEKLAEAFQIKLYKEKLIKDQSVLMKTVPKAFTGKDAVTIIQKILQPKNDEPSASISRGDAVDIGNEMMMDYNFFKHALDHSKSLQDTATDLYQFDHNLPCQVRRVKDLYKSHWDVAHLLGQHIVCQDRRHLFRVFPKCFVAKEAVDVMVNLKLVQSRREAVHLMKKLNHKVFFCAHVMQEHEFKDEYLFFEFIPQNERMPEPLEKPPSPKQPHKNKKRRSNKGKGTPVPPKQLDKELKKANQRRADDIRNRLANYKQEMMKQKRYGNAQAQ